MGRWFLGTLRREQGCETTGKKGTKQGWVLQHIGGAGKWSSVLRGPCGGSMEHAPQSAPIWGQRWVLTHGLLSVLACGLFWGTLILSHISVLCTQTENTLVSEEIPQVRRYKFWSLEVGNPAWKWNGDGMFWVPDAPPRYLEVLSVPSSQEPFF